jgi:hypothetical protein
LQGHRNVPSIYICSKSIAKYRSCIEFKDLIYFGMTSVEIDMIFVTEFPVATNKDLYVVWNSHWSRPVFGLIDGRIAENL